MIRRALVATAICAQIAAVAAAQDGSVDVEVSTAFNTKYIWNGFDRLASRGLETGPVMQPRVDVAIASSPLHAHVGGSFVMNNESELHETTYGVYLHRATSPLASATFGYNFYDDRVALDGFDNTADLHEIWGSVVMRSTVGTRTQFTAKYENPAAEGHGSFTVVVGEIGYNVPVVPMVSARGFGLELDTSTAVVYTSGMKVQDIETVDGGVSAWQVGVASNILTGSVRIRPSVHYQVTFKDTVNDRNPFWAGVDIAYAF